MLGSCKKHTFCRQERWDFTHAHIHSCYKVWKATTGGVKKTWRRRARVFQRFFVFFSFVWARLLKVSVRVRQHLNSISTTKNMDNVTNTSSKGCQDVWRICTSLSNCYFHSLHDDFRHFSGAQWRESGETVWEKVCYIILIHEIHCVSPLAFFPPTTPSRNVLSERFYKHFI